VEETDVEIRRTKKNILCLAVVALILLAAVAIAGFHLSPHYFWGAVFVAPLLGAAARLYFKLRRLKTLLGLRKRWAMPVDTPRDFEKISTLHGFMAGNELPGMIDRQTWRDLDGDQIYALLDRTFTAPGQAVLYTILKNPSFDRGLLEKRSRLIRLFQKDDCFREKLQLLLLPLERARDSDMANLLWEGLPSPSPHAPLFTVLALAAMISLFTPLFLGKYSIPMILGMFGINSWVHYHLTKKYQNVLSAIPGLAVLLKTASKVADLKVAAMGDVCEQLRNASLSCRHISRNIAYLQPTLLGSELDFLYEYLKVYFLLEVRAYNRTLSEFKKRVEQLQEIYLIIGELDAMQSIASYREGLPAPGYVEPELVAGGEPICAVDNVRHPLLNDAVANSIIVDREGVLITGSNMSGKSTFLRTIAVNAVFAQTIFTCLASSYRGSFFRVITSISREDSLMEGRSFYYREAERLLKLVRAATGADVKAPALCIIDELLSGTNYTERFAASQGILSYLASRNARVLAATHDLDLAEKLQGSYCCYYFSDRVGQEGLDFDYKLKKGVSTNRNAIKLLEYMEYPREITEQANTIARQLTSGSGVLDGPWNG
jgi:hypothetical protein